MITRQSFNNAIKLLVRGIRLNDSLYSTHTWLMDTYIVLSLASQMRPEGPHVAPDEYLVAHATFCNSKSILDRDNKSGPGLYPTG